MTTNYLHNLTTKELLLILKHVQFGHDHLSKKLPKNEYGNLLSIGSLSNTQLAKIESDNQEKLGNISVVVNTILTSCFGAWLGFCGFSNTPIVSSSGLFIIVTAISLGLLVGFLSYTLTFKQARLAFRHQQLCNVQRVIIDIIINKRQNKIDAVRNKIYLMLKDLDPSISNLNETSEKRLFDALLKLKPTDSTTQFSKLIKKSFKQITHSIKRLNQRDKLQELSENMTFDSSDFLLNNALTNASYIKILTKSDLPSKYHIPQIHSWFKRNFVGVSVGLLPTFLGSFASMFVFLNGFPAFLDQLGIYFNFTHLQLTSLKISMLSLAFSISIYFAYSHIHSNYKSFRRVKQLEISENMIADKLNTMIQLISQLNHWARIASQLQLICDLKKYSEENHNSQHVDQLYQEGGILDSRKIS